jgi:hypothetical protein
MPRENYYCNDKDSFNLPLKDKINIILTSYFYFIGWIDVTVSISL